MESKKKEIIKLNFKPVGLVEQICTIMTNLILEGKIESGKQLVEAELQKQLGTSRSPIRESFRILERQGLVEFIPRKGVFVKAETRKDIEERFPVRAVLEGLAAREALGKLTPTDLSNMKAELKKMETSLKKNDLKMYKEVHFEFHEIFINASKNELLINFLKSLRLKGKWSNYSQQYFREDYHKILEVHRTILELFEGECSEMQRVKVESVVRKHIESAVIDYLNYFEDQEKKIVNANQDEQ
jgi:DNA-binding GntR family transcriptional regulator